MEFCVGKKIRNTETFVDRAPQIAGGAETMCPATAIRPFEIPKGSENFRHFFEFLPLSNGIFFKSFDGCCLRHCRQNQKNQKSFCNR